MGMMKFTAYIGKSKIATGRGYMRALRAILENGERLVEAGCVVCRIDLDISVPDGRIKQTRTDPFQKLPAFVK